MSIPRRPVRRRYPPPARLKTARTTVMMQAPTINKAPTIANALTMAGRTKTTKAPITTPAIMISISGSFRSIQWAKQPHWSWYDGFMLDNCTMNRAIGIIAKLRVGDEIGQIALMHGFDAHIIIAVAGINAAIRRRAADLFPQD